MSPTWNATEYFLVAALAGVAAVACYGLSAVCLRERRKHDTWFMAKLGTAFALGGTGTALIAASGGNFGSLIAIIGVALLGVGVFGLCRTI